MSTNTIIYIIIGIIVLFAIIYLIANAFKKRKSTSSNGAGIEYINEQIYIGNLPYHVSERDLSSYFERYGQVTQAKVVKNYKTGRSKGFAFITFTSFDEAKKALQAHGEIMKGRNMVVRIAKPR